MFADPAFERELRSVIATGDAADARATAARIVDGDADSWLREWTASGGEAWAAARRTPSAALYLHAAACYAAALALISATDGSVDEAALRDRGHECWERAVTLLGGTRTRYGAFMAAAAAGPRPLVAIVPGDRPAAAIALAVIAHGWHWLELDDPAELTPAADAMLVRPDVTRIAAVALGDAVDDVARALAADRRFSAAVLEWPAELPPTARDALLARDRDAFERELHLVRLFDRHATARLGASPYARLLQARELASAGAPTIQATPDETVAWLERTFGST